jgi:hypothetical protein
MDIYLDTCSLCRPFDDQSKLRIKIETEAVQFIFEQIKKKKVKWIASEVLEFEINQINNLEKRIKILSFLKIANSKIKYSDKIEEKGIQIEKKGFNLLDALHISCSISSSAKYFITTVFRLKRRDLIYLTHYIFLVAFLRVLSILLQLIMKYLD